MNNNQNCKCGVVVKSHRKSHITIIPINSSAFDKIFNCKSPRITYPVEIGNDITESIVVLQATTCDDYAIIEYVSEIDYYFSKEGKK